MVGGARPSTGINQTALPRVVHAAVPVAHLAARVCTVAEGMETIAALMHR